MDNIDSLIEKIYNEYLLNMYVKDYKETEDFINKKELYIKIYEKLKELGRLP